MRWFGFLLAIILPIIIGGPRSKPLAPNYTEQLTISATPVVLDQNDPTRVRTGALTLIAGWRLASPSPQFSGWSALHVEGNRFTAIGDLGTVLRFRLGRFGHPVDAQITSLPTGCAQTDDKRTRDSESLTSDGRSWWVGYESRHRLCRLSSDFIKGEAVYTPPDMKNWPKHSGAEAMVRLTDGRFFVFAEAARSNDGTVPLLVFAGDPTDPTTAVVKAHYRLPEGYAPTDAAQLPDGRLILLNRSFSVPRLFESVITIIDPAIVSPGRIVEGRVIARLTPPLLSDNFEGVAVTREGQRTMIWIISDDNSMTWQATYLLKFALDERTNSAVKQRAVRPSLP